MPDSNELRRTAMERYVELAEKGEPITLRQMAERSLELFGQSISWDMLRQWSSWDDWKHRLGASMNASPKLQRIKAQFDMWYRKWVTAESHKDKATAARTFNAVVKKIPLAFRPAVEFEIVEVRNSIAQYTIRHEHDCPDAQLSTMTRALMDLENAVEVFVEIEHDGVNLDEAVLDGRL